MTEMNRTRFVGLKAWLLSGIGCVLATAWMQAAAQTPSPSPNGQATASNNSNLNSAPLSAAPAVSRAWRQLTPMQRQALAPLGAQWSALSTQQQAKWLTLSKNFTQLTVADQITMHSRMADWVDLSPQQRNLARLNFNQFQYLPKEDKKAQWEAYQALPTEKKLLLSAGTASPAKSAAPTIKPLEAHRQVHTPVRASANHSSAPAAIDRKTLLPRQPTLAAPTQGTPLPPSTDLPEGLPPPSETAPS